MNRPLLLRTWGWLGLRTAIIGLAVVAWGWLMPFLYGNRWRHAELLRRGFAQVACLHALSGDDAIARALSLDGVATLSLDAVHSADACVAQAQSRQSGRSAAGERQVRRERRSMAVGTEETRSPVLQGGVGVGAGDSLSRSR